MIRPFVAGIVLSVVLGAAAWGAEGRETKFNVLFIATDDWRTELGCYGAAGMQSPNVDKFAASAVRFDRAYCQFPLCNPSRTSMLTGRYPTTTGVLNNETAFREAHPDWVTLPQCFREQGYVTARTGKIFHGGIDDPKAWSEVSDDRFSNKNSKSATNDSRSPRILLAAQETKKKKKKKDPANSDRIVVLDDDGQSHVDYKTADNGIALLEKHQGERFFIAVGFTKPHSPPSAPKKFFDQYDAAKIELPPDFAPRPTVPPGFPAASVPPRNGDLFIEHDASPEAAREMIRAYRASASWTDWNIGRVLGALDRLKLAENTIVVFFGDHGYHLGEKGKWSKHGSLFEVGLRVPLVIGMPGAAGNGKTCERTTQLLDVYPTLVEACGLSKPPGLEGHSLVPLLRDPLAAWDHPAMSVKGSKDFGRSIRTQRWRYSDWDDGAAGAVLFDEQSDPHEMRNLAADPTHAATVKELKAALDKDLPKR